MFDMMVDGRQGSLQLLREPSNAASQTGLYGEGLSSGGGAWWLDASLHLLACGQGSVSMKAGRCEDED
jgi:hypothetical protein